MRLFLHDLEELYNRGSHGNHGNMVKTFRDSKNIFVHIIYRDRAIAHTFQYSLLASSLESIQKSQIEISNIRVKKTAHACILRE